MSLIDKIIEDWEDHIGKGNKTLGTLPTDWEIELEQYVRDNQTSYYLVFAGNPSRVEVPMGADITFLIDKISLKAKETELQEDIQFLDSLVSKDTKNKKRFDDLMAKYGKKEN